VPDDNPETVIIGEPLDGTSNPSVAIGTTLTSITGVVQYQFGFYYVLPLTAPTILTSPSSTVPPTTITPQNNSCVVTLGDYNIDNFAGGSRTTLLATHIAQFLKTPDLVHVQEIQDNNGPTDDGTVNANLTLQGLVDAIKNASGGVEYAFVDVDPVNNQDGGEPGGNIRQAYLYRPERIQLAGNSPVGGSLDATAVEVGHDGKLGLTCVPTAVEGLPLV
jgi:predicted extracellular nuclease